jgi:hypothetical protein
VSVEIFGGDPNGFRNRVESLAKLFAELLDFPELVLNGRETGDCGFRTDVSRRDCIDGVRPVYQNRRLVEIWKKNPRYSV